MTSEKSICHILSDRSVSLDFNTIHVQLKQLILHVLRNFMRHTNGNKVLITFEMKQWRKNAIAEKRFKCKCKSEMNRHRRHRSVHVVCGFFGHSHFYMATAIGRRFFVRSSLGFDWSRNKMHSYIYVCIKNANANGTVKLPCSAIEFTQIQFRACQQQRPVFSPNKIRIWQISRLLPISNIRWCHGVLNAHIEWPYII